METPTIIPTQNSKPISSLSGAGSEAVSTPNPAAVPAVKPVSDIKRDTVRINTGGGFVSNGNSKKLVFALLGVFIIVLGIMGFFFYKSGKVSFLDPTSTASDNSGGATVAVNSGSTEFEDPINGVYFSAVDATGFKDHKPVAIMVNNHPDARPASGLSKADIIYEGVAEGGITRLMPIFYSQSPENVSSIRSARYFFVQLASAYKPIYIHWGAAFVPDCQKVGKSDPNYCDHDGKVETNPEVDAKDWIVKLGVANLDVGGYETSCDIKDSNCFVSRDPVRIASMGTLHAGFVKYPLIFQKAKDLRPEPSWNEFQPFDVWKFKDDAGSADRGDIGLSSPITYSYWTSMTSFDVKWEYDKDANLYTRYQGGVKQTDSANGEDLKAKVIIIRFTDQKSADDYKAHLIYDLVGTGDAMIFQDGKIINATWTRTDPDVRDIYTNTDGTQVEFDRGQIWVQLVPTGNTVSYGS